jgi:hypothetical protein
MQSNPIQQRIELICEKWEESKRHRHARIVRMQCQPDETDMVETFYTYMIANDTPVLDIAFHFDSPCSDLKSFSESLLKELEEVIDIWNTSQKPEQLPFVAVNWKPDYSMMSAKNAAFLFVSNFNSLAKELNLQPGLLTVAIFKMVPNAKLLVWLKQAIEAGISPDVKFLVYDSISEPSFDKLARNRDLPVYTIPINLNMPKAMEQIAAMGDPNDPGTAYRAVFMKMINAMGVQNEAEAEKCGFECVAIANQHLGKDPYWVMQIVMVYIALGNDKIRYKKKKETLAYADKAVETAVASQQYFANDTASSLLAQALMFRATVLFVQGKYGAAFNDYSVAFDVYQKQKNTVMATEACRMAGLSAFKESQQLKGIKILSEGARLGRNLDPQTARASTFAGLLELLVPSHHEAFISSNEIDEICLPLYGKDFKKMIFNWKKVHEDGLLQPS